MRKDTRSYPPRCNHCGESTYKGMYKYKKWFCEICLEHNEISPKDNIGNEIQERLK